MWAAIIQFITMFSGGVAVGTMLEEESDPTPIIIQQAAPAPVLERPPVIPTQAEASMSGANSPMLIFAASALVLSTGYFVRACKGNGNSKP